jgi:hypothetical protein
MPQALLQELTPPQIVRKFPTYKTQKFIKVFTTAHSLSLILSHVNTVYTPHPSSLRSTLILSSNLLQGIPTVSFLHVSSITLFMHFSVHPMRATRPAPLIPHLVTSTHHEAPHCAVWPRYLPQHYIHEHAQLSLCPSLKVRDQVLYIFISLSFLTFL